MNELVLKPTELKQYLASKQTQIESALPRTIGIQRFMSGVYTLMRTPSLRACTTESIVGGMLLAAQSGLELNTVMGQAWLVPFWNDSKKVKEAQFILGYRGIVDLGYRSGGVADIVAREVYEGDKFDFEYGLHPKLMHKPNLKERGEITAFYALARLTTKGAPFEVLDISQVLAKKEAALKKAKDPKNPMLPWNAHFVAMGRKSCITPLKPWLPLSVELRRPMDYDEAVIELPPDPEQDLSASWEEYQEGEVEG